MFYHAYNAYMVRSMQVSFLSRYRKNRAKLRLIKRSCGNVLFTSKLIGAWLLLYARNVVI